MTDLLNQIFQAMNARLRSPFIGYFILAQIYLNYAAFILLLWGEGSVDDRVDCFAATVTFQRFVVLPILISLVGGILGPWIKFGGAWVAKWPSERLKKLESDEARKLRIHDFEQATEELTAEAEFNRTKVAVAESLKRAEEVGGDELVADIQAGPSGLRSKGDDPESAKAGVLDKLTEKSDEDAALRRVHSKKMLKERAKEAFEDYWQLELAELVLKIPSNVGGKTAIVQANVQTGNPVFTEYRWELVFRSGQKIDFGTTTSESNFPAALKTSIDLGIFEALDKERLRVSTALEDWRNAANEWLSKNNETGF